MENSREPRKSCNALSDLALQKPEPYDNVGLLLLFNFFLTSYLVGTMKARVLAPISTEGVTVDDVPELTENVREKMLKVFLEGDPSKSLKDTVSTEDKKIK